VAEKILNHAKRQINAVREFLVNPEMGIYELQDKLIRNLRVFINELLGARATRPPTSESCGGRLTRE
jgi:uncharacterized UPF0146 family protein